MTKKIISLLILGLLFQFQIALSQEGSSEKKKAETRSAEQEKLQVQVEGKDELTKETILLKEFEKEQRALYPAHSKNVTPEKQNQLNEIIEVMDEEVPNSFSWNYATYVNANRSLDNVQNLKEAYDIQPNDARVITEYVALGEIQGNRSMKKEFCQKLDDKGIYTLAEKEYNSNVLVSVEAGAYIITNGNVDTYPAWIEQELNGRGKNTKVLNLDLLQNENYRQKIFSTMGIPQLNGLKSNELIIDHILTHKKHGEVYLGLTVAHHILIKYSKNLYLSGLALVYDVSPDVDYNSILDANWRNNFDKEHIEDKVAINKNYLLMLKKLHTYYEGVNKDDEATEVKNIIEIIVKNFGLRNPLN